MKIQPLLCSVIALWPACALAQNQNSPSNPKPVPVAPVSMEPAAQALLDKAIENYKAVSGIQYTIARSYYSDAGVKRAPRFHVTRYSRPDKLNIATVSGRSSLKIVSDGSSVYKVIGDEYYQSPASAYAVSDTIGYWDTSGQLIAAMLNGTDPISRQPGITSGAFKSSPISALPPRVIDGEVLKGIRYVISAGDRMSEKELKLYPEMRSYRDEVTAWFGGTPLLLRRVQSSLTVKPGRIITVSEKISDQQLSPSFEADTFKWDENGLKPASERDDNEPYWNPSLKVGTKPIAFSSPSLQGRTVSLEQYKGKVVLVDFWATWCGPCIEGLPEIKGAYDKYHSKGLEVLSISLDEDKKALESFVKTRKMGWPQLFDGQAWKGPIPTAYGVKAIPFLLLIGKDGKIAAVNPRGNVEGSVKAALAK